MTNDKTILADIDPEISGRILSRRGSFGDAAVKLGVLATASTVLGVASTAAFGQGEKLPRKIVEVLNFALTLEYLEDEFYRTAVGTDKLIPSENRTTFETISKHETAHVELLKSVLGSHAVKKPEFDYTAKGAFGDVFSNYKTFLAVSQAFEDTGVRAYKGQAGNLMGNDEILTVALQIHSVEARHAAEVRLIRGQPAWIVGNSRGDMPEATQAIYNGEADFMQGGADIKDLGGLSADALSGAFDEPLSKGKVLAIAKMFIKAA
jgi:rubrerythrin